MPSPIKLLFCLLMCQSGVSNITQPNNPIHCIVGNDALFKWTTADGGKIYSVVWGIKINNTVESQFINTNIHNNIVNYNSNMDSKYKGRVGFVGNLNKGQAWFVLRSVRISDIGVYFSHIRDERNGVLTYTVKLKVEKEVIGGVFESSINGLVGQDVYFKFTTENNNPIIAAQFGIRNSFMNTSEDCELKTNLVTVTKANETVFHGDPVYPKATSYRNRVEFIGNLSLGRAWFKLKNVSVTDKNDYLACIRQDNFKPNIMHYVKLIVEQKTKTDGVTPTIESTQAINSSTTKTTGVLSNIILMLYLWRSFLLLYYGT